MVSLQAGFQIGQIGRQHAVNEFADPGPVIMRSGRIRTLLHHRQRIRHRHCAFTQVEEGMIVLRITHSQPRYAAIALDSPRRRLVPLPC